MTDSLLRALREHVLDEAEPLAGLLRKCLMLGAETGSDSLRGWARKELDGYGDDEDVPEYRKIAVPIKMDSISGNTHATGQMIDRFQMPRKCWDYVPDKIGLKQPIAELEELATCKTVAFANSGLAYAQSLWNQELGPWQAILNLSYTSTGPALAGIVSQVRTHLVEVVADLTSDTPLKELPRKEDVDAAVSNRIGQARDIYNTTIHHAGGPVAIGAEAEASTEGVAVEDALELLDKVRELAGTIQAVENDELMRAVADLREALAEEFPDTGDVVKKAGVLRAIGEKVGVASVTTAVSSAVQVVMSMAISGAFA